MRLLVFAVFSFSICSCVSNKRFVYLQKDDLHKKNIPVDSILRKYTLETFEYKIQPEDIISVRFESLTLKENDFFSKDASPQGNIIQGNAMLIGEIVDKQGMIRLPAVGKVHVAGLTIFQIQDTLQAIAEKYLESPLVKVRLLNYRATILGEVNREGNIVFQNNRVSILEAIGLAGGLGELANKQKIKLIRQQGDSTYVSYINLLKEDVIGSEYYYLHQNDVIIVPPLRQRPFRKYVGANLAIILSTVSLVLLTINLINTN